VSKTDADVSLESDRLEQYLETADPAQPVVVIQYRNRGVSSWLFYTLIVVIPLGAIWIYHRLVVERYRVQDIVETRRAMMVPAASPTQTAIVLAPADVTTAVSSAPVPAAQSQGAAPAAALSPAHDPSPAHDQENPALAAANAQPPHLAESSPPGAGKKAGPRLRTILPNPFAPDDHPAAASTKPDGGGLAALGGTISAPAGVPSNVARDARPPANVQDDRAGPAAVADDHATEPVRDRRPPSRDGKEVRPALQPLPSKEENLRQFAEEAAKNDAELLARDETRQAEIRARRNDERVKFHQELREILRIHGNDGGPEIDKLAKRTGFDVDARKYDHARQAWINGRMALHAKVRMIRSLELPETVILDFLSDDLDTLRRTPKGPRNANEVRVFAARQLLRFVPSVADPAVRPGAGTGPGRTPTKPADGARPRPQ